MKNGLIDGFLVFALLRKKQSHNFRIWTESSIYYTQHVSNVCIPNNARIVSLWIPHTIHHVYNSNESTDVQTLGVIRIQL